MVKHEVQCDRRCGFRVHDRYFEIKRQFGRFSCPKCGGPLQVVERGTDKVVPGAKVSPVDGRIVGIMIEEEANA